MKGCSQARWLVFIKTEVVNFCGGSWSWSTQKGLMLPKAERTLILKADKSCYLSISLLGLFSLHRVKVWMRSSLILVSSPSWMKHGLTR